MRAIARLKDEFGGRTLRVRGHLKDPREFQHGLGNSALPGRKILQKAKLALDQLFLPGELRVWATGNPEHEIRPS
jgi:hypothetical protein